MAIPLTPDTLPADRKGRVVQLQDLWMSSGFSVTVMIYLLDERRKESRL